MPRPPKLLLSMIYEKEQISPSKSNVFSPGSIQASAHWENSQWKYPIRPNLIYSRVQSTFQWKQSINSKQQQRTKKDFSGRLTLWHGKIGPQEIQNIYKRLSRFSFPVFCHWYKRLPPFRILISLFLLFYFFHAFPKLYLCVFVSLTQPDQSEERQLFSIVGNCVSVEWKATLVISSVAINFGGQSLQSNLCPDPDQRLWQQCSISLQIGNNSFHNS